MIWIVARKEFFEKILDFRVITSFVIAIVLTVIVAFVVGEDYKAKKASYDQEVSLAEQEYRQIRVFYEFSKELVYPPSALGMLSRGSDIGAPVSIVVTPTKVPRFEPRNISSNVLLRIFDPLDLVTVFQILFALLVILVTYDSFSGEKENGTLRLVMTASASRIHLYLGKLLGTLMIIFAVTALAFGVALLGLQVVSGINLGVAEYASSFMIFVVSALYLQFFASLGLLFSLAFRHSSTSLVVSLLFWFTIAIVQPNLNAFVTTELEDIPRYSDIEPVLGEMEKEIDKQVAQWRKDSYALGQPLVVYGSESRISDAEYRVFDYAFKRAQAQTKYIEAAEDAWRRYEKLYDEPLKRQANLNHILDNASPARLLQRSASVLSGTDAANYDAFLRDARQFRSHCVDYLNQKGVLTVDAHRLFTRLRREDLDPEATARRIELYKKDPSAIPWIDRLPPLDLADAPSFRPTKTGMFEDVSGILLNSGLLVFYSILLGFGALILLSKYDVR